MTNPKLTNWLLTSLFLALMAIIGIVAGLYNAQFDRQERRLDQVNRYIDTIQSAHLAGEGRLSRVEEAGKNIQSQFASREARVDFQLDKIDDRLNTLNIKIDTLIDRLQGR